ncbi:MAG: hypothetical protein MJA83_04915 [Gammaproteobacteria bacterium]|nr:hypothetical protein [Gammaproteobacteria bacterium]
MNRVPFYIKLEMNGISVNFISYHAPSPDTLNTLRRKKPGKNNNVTRFKRNTQFKIINKELKKMDAPFIFSGDFNTKGKYLAELSTFFDIDDCKNDFFNTREYRIPPATTLKAIPTKKSKEYKKFQASENKSKKMTTRPDSKGSYEEFLEYNFFSRPIALSAPSARRKFIGNNAYITPGSYYDHIFAKGLEINNASTYDFVESFGLNNNYATFNIARAISDHFPVYATLKFSDGSTSTTTSDSSDNQHTTKPVEPPMKKKRTTRGNLQKT